MGLKEGFTGLGRRKYDLALLFEDTAEEYYTREDTSLFEDAFNYQPTERRHLEAMCEYLRLGERDVFVDLGCGKGRVVYFVALQNVKKVVGVELRRTLAEFARRKASEITTLAPVDIVHGDAARFFSPDGTVFYLFNPFGPGTVREVIGNIRKSYIACPRPIRIVYNNTVHSWHLDNADWLEKEGRIPGTVTWVWRTK